MKAYKGSFAARLQKNGELQARPLDIAKACLEIGAIPKCLGEIRTDEIIILASAYIEQHKIREAFRDLEKGNYESGSGDM